MLLFEAFLLMSVCLCRHTSFPWFDVLLRYSSQLRDPREFIPNALYSEWRSKTFLSQNFMFWEDRWRKKKIEEYVEIHFPDRSKLILSYKDTESRLDILIISQLHFPTRFSALIFNFHIASQELNVLHWSSWQRRLRTRRSKYIATIDDCSMLSWS